MRSLRDRLRLARIVLGELKKSPFGRTELEKRTVRKLGTHSTFESIFRFLVENGYVHFLVENGYVQKGGEEHRAPYVITERGLKLQEAL